VQVDIRDEAQIQQAVQLAVQKFGGIDVVINNASAIQLTPTEKTETKRFDLMQSINVRGTFLVVKNCLPYLKKGNNPHILTLSPPINMNPK
ncbi:SDR family NAD(P)-dependent oxidoreductase, partial [Staphylococcus aureus]